MERFLSRCAGYIHEKHGDELKDICLVFPNRRSGVFFKSYLGRQLSHPVIGPKVTTVNELIGSYSDWQQGEKLQLISILYDVFKKHTQTTETFDDFYFWGEVLLSDFNDIDRYLANAKDLFTNIADLKEIEAHFDYLSDEQKEALARFWGSMAVAHHKANHEKFLFIWKKLYPVYRDFKVELQKRGIAFGGMIDRWVVENLEKGDFQFPFSKYYIVGLNALNSCEKLFFKYLKQLGKVEFLWDYDRFYLDDPNNEAGWFMRENLKRFPPPANFLPDANGFEKRKDIRLTAVSSNYGQAQEIPRFMQQIKPEFKHEFDNTAVVLADESLLFPALGAIPEEFGKVNVTMGYPVKNSVVYGFLLLLINLLKNRKLNGEQKTVVYHRFVTDVLNHQLLSNTEPEKTKAFLSKIKEENQIVIPLEIIDFSDLHKLIFTLPEKVEDYSSWFLEILGRFYGMIKEADPGNQLLPELIYSIYLALEKLKTVILNVQDEQAREISEAVFFRLFHQYLGQVSVSFEGEPLSGMQVMGILETRCLDFENLIILGLNENKWPRKFTAPSFIPFNIRKGFGLPGIDEQDAMYAYYFYRLIQRAKTVSATYSTLKEGIGTGELSRYGYQLRYDSNQKPQMVNLDFQFSNDPAAPIVVEGSPEKLSVLLERNSAERPLSPTAINTYLQCSLRFYFRYILQLPEPDEMKDEIDSPVFGNIFHETVENLYKPFVGKVVTKLDLEKIQKDKIRVENEIRKAIGRNYFKQRDPDAKTVKLEGKTILIYENTKTFVKRLLDIDMQQAPLELVALEGNYKTMFNINLKNEITPVSVGGKIDRIDIVNGQVRVIDYKTGNVTSFSFKALDELFEHDLEKPKKEILQALIYSLVYKDEKDIEDEIQPAIYSLRKLFGEKFAPEIKYNSKPIVFQELEQEFRDKMHDLVAEIYSSTATYSQTPHEKVCQNCPYNKICQRY
jgi:CRISPR/Cas system-associated exonuclease Cas4 (RecB family)